MLVHPGLEMDCDSSVAGLLHIHRAQPTSATQMSGCVPVISAIVPATCSWGNEQVPGILFPSLGPAYQPGIFTLRTFDSQSPKVPPLSLVRPWGLSKFECKYIS